MSVRYERPFTILAIFLTLAVQSLGCFQESEIDGSHDTDDIDDEIIDDDNTEDSHDFRDDFDDPDFGNWELWGDPRPQWVNAVHGREGIFHNFGDGSWNSGAVTRQEFDQWTDGFEIQADIYIELQNIEGCWAGASVDIADDERDMSNDTWPTVFGMGLTFYGDACFETPSEYQRHTYWNISVLTANGVEGPGEFAISADEFLDEWVSVKISVDSDGFARFYANGLSLYESIDPFLEEKRKTPRRLSVGGRSSGYAGFAFHDFVSLKFGPD